MEENTTNETVTLLGLVISAALSFLLLPDGGHAVEVLLAAVVANRLNGDPFWLMFVNQALTDFSFQHFGAEGWTVFIIRFPQFIVSA